jgi:hypothetical protein
MTCLTPVGPVQAEASTDEHGRSARMVQPDDTSRTAAGRTADERSAISPTNSSNTRSRARSTAPTARLDHGCRVGRSRRDQCRRSTAAAKPRVRAHGRHRPAEQRASILSPGKRAGKECVLPTIPRADIGRKVASAVRGSRLVTEGHAPHLRDGGIARSFVTDRPVSKGFPARSWCCVSGFACGCGSPPRRRRSKGDRSAGAREIG